MKPINQKSIKELQRLGLELDNALATAERCTNHAAQIIGIEDWTELFEMVQEARDEGADIPECLVWHAKRTAALNSVLETIQEFNITGKELEEEKEKA